MNFALCTDENFVVPALICITSILEHNKTSDCKIYVLTEGISTESITKFQRLAEIYNQTIRIIEIHNTYDLDSLITRSRYPKSMYFRFFLPELLTEVSKILYLDCDTMVRRDLNELFRIDITGKACGVVIDQQCDDVQIQNRLRITHNYFNSGVMLMNLHEWRMQNYAEKIISYIVDHPNKCIYPDQDGLNKILEGKVIYLNPAYNMQEMWLTMLDYTRFHYSRYNELELAKRDPFIVHFCVGDKPWYKECRNPFKAEFIEYANKYKFIGFKEKQHYSGLYYRIDAGIQRLLRWQKRFVNK